MDDTVANRLLAKLRQLSPVKVRAYDAEDNPRDIAVPTRRKRWSAVIEAVEARPWIRVECLDRSGAVLGYVTNDGPAEDVEELGVATPGGAVAMQQRWLLELMIRAQQTALTYRDKEHSALLVAVRDIMAVQSEATRELVVLMRAQRDIAAEMAAQRAAAAAGSGELDLDTVVALLKESPKMLKELGPIIFGLGRMVAGGMAPAPPTNGVKP